MTAAFKHEDLMQKLQNDTDESLKFEVDPGQCCIYRVPRMIRTVNEEFYTPKLISIGPLHHGKSELADMENKKKEYVKSFLQRTTKEKIDKILSFINDKEKQIRACYAEAFTLRSPQFVMMILYDSIFIIEIFLREHLNNGSDILLATIPLHHTLCTDLQLFENQLPYFVLEEIYGLAGIHISATFMQLSYNFFSAFISVELSDLLCGLAVRHFTDWRRITLLKSYQAPELAKGWIKGLPSAVKLHESGVKFKPISDKGEQSLFDIKFEKRKRLIPFFEVHELQIPQLLVSDRTEQLLGNIIALELCLYPNDPRVYYYVQLMHHLINTEEDVNLLVENRIIFNHMGDNASVAKIFDKLHILHSQSSYHNLCEQLKEHYNNPWNKAKAKTKPPLKKVYFSDPLRGTATVAAIILMLLTIVQTICSILQVL